MASSVSVWDSGPAGVWIGPGDPGVPGKLTVWDTITISSWKFAGTIKGSFGTKVDVKSHLGRSGSALANNGSKTSRISVTLKIWTNQQESDLKALMQYLQSQQNASAAVMILHPSLQLADSTSLYPVDFDVFVPPEGNRVGTQVLHFRKWLPPPTGPGVTVQPNASRPPTGIGGASPQKPPPAPPSVGVGNKALPPSPRQGP